MCNTAFIHVCSCGQAKEFVANPSAFAALAPVEAAAPVEDKEDVKEAAKQEESEDSDDDMGFGLFD